MPREHSELAEFLRKYGRIVLRGDTVKTDDGEFAVFTEQGTSASHLAAAKFIDAIARLPGNDGKDSDAVGAYTQVLLSDADRLLGPGKMPEIWISLPKTKQPASWEGIKDPVCPLLVNLYGHPMAGLLWEKFCEEILLSEGFEKVPSWECLYVHRQQKIFMSVYVDDFKGAGDKENLAAMWKKLGDRKSTRLNSSHT